MRGRTVGGSNDSFYKWQISMYDFETDTTQTSKTDMSISVTANTIIADLRGTNASSTKDPNNRASSRNDPDRENTAS